MELDTRTTIVASFIVAAMLSATALVFARSAPAGQRGAGPLKLWGLGLALLALGFLGVASRGTLPDFLTIVVANTLIVAALVVSYRSLRGFKGVPPADPLGWSLVGGTFVVLWLLLEVWPSLTARILVLCAVRTFLLARNAWALGRDIPDECRVSFGFTRGIFWVAAIAMVARGALVVAAPPAADFMSPNPVHAWPYLVFACVIVAATLGMFWMVVQLLQLDLVRLATLDSLTGLLNRQSFLTEFAREASRSKRGNLIFSLAVFDLDHFKGLNDKYGHPAGDEALRLVVGAMQDCLRGHDLLGRLGGEEFALLMPGADKETALRVAERIRVAVEALQFAPKGERVPLNVSGGVAMRGADGTDWETLFAAADGALYKAKNAGRNRMAAAGA